MSKFKSLLKESAAELKTTRCLALTALFIALNVVLDLLNIRIQLTPELRIGFGFVCNATIGMLFGPVVGMSAGFCTDVLGYLVNQGGGYYFPGYTLTAIAGGLIYGLWLYRPERGGQPFRSRQGRAGRIARVIGAKVTINIVCNMGLNTLWLTMTQGKGFLLLFPVRAVKNLMLLPLECILLFFASEFALAVYYSLGTGTRRL